MTAIAIWLNNENTDNPTLWAAADTKVSGNGNIQLIGDAVKISPLHIICRRPGPQGFFDEIYHTHSLGYCFAGSTLMGQNTLLGLSPLLSNLISCSSYVPFIKDIAQQAHTYLKLTFDAYKPIGAHNALFEVAIFGHCSRNQQPEIFHYRTELVENVYQVTMTAYQSLQLKDFVYLGNHRDNISDKIVAAFAAEPIPGRPTSRAPKYVIEECINSENFDSVGGDLQLAIADRSGFRPYALLKPRVQGQPEAYLTYLGYELTGAITTVGEAMVSVDGMAG